MKYVFLAALLMFFLIPLSAQEQTDEELAELSRQLNNPLGAT